MMNRSENFYKLISVIVAITLWCYVIITSEPMQVKIITNVPVNLINTENLTARDLVISGETNFTVNVKIKGRSSKMIEVGSEQITVNADLFGYTPGSNYVKLETKLPEDIELVDIDPGSIIVNIDEVVAHSKPIEVVYTGEFKDNSEGSLVSTQPESIEVSGPKTIVDQVAYVKATVDASNIEESGKTVQAKGAPVNSKGEIVAGVNLSSDVVDVTTKLLQVKTVDLDVPIEGEIKYPYEVEKLETPDKITIRGDKSLLEDIEKIKANPVDLSGITTNTRIAIVPILPEGIEVSQASEDISVSVQLKGITEKMFKYSAYEISVENMPELLKLAIGTPEIQIRIVGRDADINDMVKGDFAPYVDLSEATIDTTSTEIFIRHDEVITTLEVIPSQVNIILSEVE